MAEKRGGLFAPRGLRTVVSVLLAATYTEVPGIESVAHSPGSRDASTISAFEGVMSVLGSQSIEPVTFNVSAYQPYQEAWMAIQEAFEANDPLTFRVRTPSAKLFPGGATLLTTAAEIGATLEAMTGANPKVAGVEFGGTDADGVRAINMGFTGDRFQRGHSIRIGGLDYVITSIDLDADGDVSDFAEATGTGGIRLRRADGMDVADGVAAAFAVYEPGVSIDFTARVEGPPGFNVGAAASSPLSATLTVRPLTPLPRPTLYTVA